MRQGALRRPLPNDNRSHFRRVLPRERFLAAFRAESVRNAPFPSTFSGSARRRKNCPLDMESPKTVMRLCLQMFAVFKVALSAIRSLLPRFSDYCPKTQVSISPCERFRRRFAAGGFSFVRYKDTTKRGRSKTTSFPFAYTVVFHSVELRSGGSTESRACVFLSEKGRKNGKFHAVSRKIAAVTVCNRSKV